MSQLDLFSADRAPAVSQQADPDKIRLILAAAVQELERSSQLPWDSPKLNSWCHLFDNMTKWLPEEERADLRKRFHQELRRLETPLPLFSESAL